MSMRNHLTRFFVTNIFKNVTTVGPGSSYNIDVVYIDFSKAIDSIVFSKLVCKQKICGYLQAWLSSFIHGRSQCFVLENCFSSVSDVISGVPPGSVLGPVLFLIFVNDVISICSGNTTF